MKVCASEEEFKIPASPGAQEVKHDVGRVTDSLGLLTMFLLSAPRNIFSFWSLKAPYLSKKVQQIFVGFSFWSETEKPNSLFLCPSTFQCIRKSKKN